MSKNNATVMALILSTTRRPSTGDVLTRGQVVELSGDDLVQLQRSGHARIALPSEIPARQVAKAEKSKQPPPAAETSS